MLAKISRLQIRKGPGVGAMLLNDINGFLPVGNGAVGSKFVILPGQVFNRCKLTTGRQILAVVVGFLEVFKSTFVLPFGTINLSQK